MLNSLMVYAYLFILSIVAGAILHWFYMRISTEDIKNLAEAFQAIGIGAAALISVIKFAPELMKVYRRNQKIKEYKKLYSASDLGNTYLLVRDPNRLPETHVYVIDKRTNKKHHVENPTTMRNLEFDWGQVKNISRDEYKSYSPGSSIDTKID